MLGTKTCIYSVWSLRPHVIKSPHHFADTPIVGDSTFALQSNPLNRSLESNTNPNHLCHHQLRCRSRFLSATTASSPFTQASHHRDPPSPASAAITLCYHRKSQTLMRPSTWDDRSSLTPNRRGTSPQSKQVPRRDGQNGY